MITITVKNSLKLFKELKTGDIFSFVSAPDRIYIKTTTDFFLDYECKGCNETDSIDLGNFCVNLKSGNLFEGNPFEKVLLYEKAELILER